ncbi:MAG: N-6 DNA methylase [Elusimicrobia bacterium]|nr:N-6 DNA methylase [Candidatus Obscuribacterium magneticum]
MLDTDTKRRIDTARDILVGKVPDPKSQVEQITIALIYKFMDDMDAESEEFGGKRKFFAKEFARYGWAKLMRSGLGGHETLNLYGEAIAKMPENPGIPLLFRDIFKNAYLPYRDPETLRAFLKVIDEFNYDHSERLGDAFEYLLSVLGSQGDAGQFRTPRHIIDFMVEIVDPKKTETVLDPACGTAGFLISSYKHILKANTSTPSPSGRGAGVRDGDLLTPDEKGRLAQNIKGYDISPDMVRLSLVNLYLHGFADPHIAEYDTLTSQDKWNEYADVILANPPFMSPKGGIKPHNRFSVQSKRSEVLFVDYMAEHLTPTGRAGIIVPEGIIFQSQTAYKDLRKMLVENALVAVVSLPAGVFNPYSGVKTSILILDKSLAKKTNTIAFFKVENDGFGLGAQRREIDKNDLPQAHAEISEYLRRLRARESIADFQPTLGLIVPKEKIAANGDYNLSGERYREGSISTSTFPSVELGEICELVRGVVFAKEDEVSEGGVKVLRANNINKDRYELNLDDIKQVSPKLDFADEKKLRQGDIFICLASGSKDHIGKVAFIKEDTDFYFGGFMGAIRVKPGRLHASYLLKQLTTGHFNDFLREQIAGANINNLSGALLYRFQIPLPPLEVQKEIVAEIEGYQKVINGARAVLDNYRPHIPIHPDWPVEPLAALFATKSGTTPSRSRTDYFKDGTIPWVKTLDLRDGPIRSTDEKITPQALDDTHLSILPVGTVLIAMYGGFNQIGRTGVLEIEATHNQAMTALLPTPRVSPYFLNAILVASKDYWKTVANSTRKDPNITKTDVLNFKLPLPPLATQQAIVAEIEAEQALVAANHELIARFEKKIRATLARVWGES